MLETTIECYLLYFGDARNYYIMVFTILRGCLKLLKNGIYYTGGMLETTIEWYLIYFGDA